MDLPRIAGFSLKAGERTVRVRCERCLEEWTVRRCRKGGLRPEAMLYLVLHLHSKACLEAAARRGLAGPDAEKTSS